MMHHHPAVRHLTLATLWQNSYILDGRSIVKFVKSIAAGKTSQAITVLLLRLVSLDDFLDVCGLFGPGGFWSILVGGVPVACLGQSSFFSRFCDGPCVSVPFICCACLVQFYQSSQARGKNLHSARAVSDKTNKPAKTVKTLWRILTLMD